MLLLTMVIYAVCARVLRLYHVYDNLTVLAKGLYLLIFRVRN